MRSGDVNFRLLGFIGWLRKELDQRGWDQKALADQTGRPDAEIQKVFQGTLTVGPLKDIAQALGVPHQVIFIKAILPEDLPQKRNVQRSARLLNSPFKKQKENAESELARMLGNADEFS